jgi:Dyp-type peroxidase family
MQEGIYYRTKPTIGNSFCIISLRAENPSKISEIGYAIGTIWNRLKKLKEGITADLDIDIKHRKIGNLTILVAYGSHVFEIPGSKKVRPASFTGRWNFKEPNPKGAGQVLEGAEMWYSKEVLDNHLLRDHVLFQLIADNEFYTNRAAVEVWKELYRQGKKGNPSQLQITGLYQGFQRADKRNWLGFHDGVSNLKTQERPYVILINSRDLSTQDKWTTHGTYLAFIRFVLDLKKWEDTPIEQQEKIIGRHKLTGCPLVRLDERGRGIKDSRCPVPGTSEIVDPGNEYFRDHPPYGFTRETKLLQFSHIGSTRPIERIPLWDKRSLRIYRQGFEFLLASNTESGFVVGLNFISFQNTPERLFRALRYQNLISQKGNMNSPIATLEQFTSVLSAGIFLVPPVVQDEPFPGAEIFFDKKEIRNFSSSL